MQKTCIEMVEIRGKKKGGQKIFPTSPWPSKLPLLGNNLRVISQRRKYRHPLTLDKVLDFGFLGPETKARGGRRPLRTLVSSFDPP